MLILQPNIITYKINNKFGRLQITAVEPTVHHASLRGSCKLWFES